MLQRKAISQKLLRVTLRTVFLRSFTILTSCKSLVVNHSPRLNFWLQKSSVTYTVTAKFKVQSDSTCTYIRSIRNYSILVYYYMRAAHTEQYPATLRWLTYLWVVSLTSVKTQTKLFR